MRAKKIGRRERERRKVMAESYACHISILFADKVSNLAVNRELTYCKEIGFARSMRHISEKEKNKKMRL